MLLTRLVKKGVLEVNLPRKQGGKLLRNWFRYNILITLCGVLKWVEVELG